MDIKKEMLVALSKRKEDEFNLGEKNLIIDGVNLGKMRAMIGYRGIDIANDVPIKKEIVNGITCYNYAISKNPKYTLFYIHGGGFYGGSALVSEYICKYMAKFGDIRVINIDYTLAPKSKFPDTAYEIYNIIKSYYKKYNNEKTKFSIAGDSAGAHLAMNVAQLDKSEILSYVALYYPVMSLDKLENWSISKYNLTEPCYHGKMTIKFLRSIMPHIKRFYVKENENPNSSMFNLNLITTEEFKLLPEIMIARAEFDYFNLEIDEFTNKYDVKVYNYKGLAHGFTELLGYVEEVLELLEITVNNLKK